MNTSSTTYAQTEKKAFRINMERSFYGSFAEIGAGQETANWFFRTSGSSGTVAKTISAYDMTVSDSLYGPVSRYVSEERLLQMMDKEYSQLIARLGDKRGADTCFFAFCNTVKCKAYVDNGAWFAWIGVRFQRKPQAPPSDFVLHVRLLAPDHDRQMNILGVLGVNILHALYFQRDRLEDFVPALGDNLNHSEFEIDMVRFSGHGFGMFDNRILALQLVQSGLAKAMMFCPDGSVRQPADLLYNRPVVLMRGSFFPLCKIHLALMESVRKKFRESLPSELIDREIDICEISLSNLLHGEDINIIDFIDRMDALAALNKTVMVTNITHFHHISSFLNSFTKAPIAIALSIGLLHETFKDKWTEESGSIFTTMGNTFINKTRFFVTPWINRKTGEFVTAGTYIVKAEYEYLYKFLLSNNLIVSVPYYDQKLLSRTPQEIIAMIHAGDDAWKEYVPEEAYRMVEYIKTHDH